MVGTVQDITERKALEARIEHQAFHDSLTGLANRALFLDRVDHALSRRVGAETNSLAVMFLDLDDFKTVNDSMGHGVGDDLLVEVASQISSALRPSDTFARLGGDEFGILLEDLLNEKQATDVAERILEILTIPVPLADTELQARASIGIAWADPNTTTTEELVRHADTAMYAAKRQGKGSFALFEPSMGDAVVQRLNMRADLQRAIADGEFILHYQPIVELDSGQVSGAEALVRWEHPVRGLVPPLQFIPYAEETGLIIPLTTWVLTEACMTAAKWEREHSRPFAIAVNISAVRFRHPGLEAEIVDVLHSSGLPPERLTLEITESVLMKDVEEVTRRLHRLKDLGVKIAIDDFGTGYSSLSYLRDFPIDLLKIDKSFVDSIALGPEDSALARAVIRLGKTLGIQTVAEGVEEGAQSTTLRRLKCDYAQGYLFSKPIDAAGIEALLLAEHEVVGGQIAPAV